MAQLIVTLLLALTAMTKGGGYFYLTSITSGDDQLITAVRFDTQTQCEAVAATATGVIQGCVPACSRGTGSAYLNQIDDCDNDHDEIRGATQCYFTGVGPYASPDDCLAGIAAAQAAGF